MEVFRRKGRELGNHVISNLFQTKSKKTEDEAKLIKSVSDVHKKVRISGADFEQLVEILDEVISQVNKEELFTERCKK